MSAAESLTRIVSLVAELSRREREGEPAPTLGDLARSFGVSAAAIEQDIRTLTLLGDHADSEWLLSLSVWQQEDRLSISSQGPFRRPLRLTPEELLAVQIALAGEGHLELAARLGALTTSDHTLSWAPPEYSLESIGPLERLDGAVRDCTGVRLLYAGEGEPEARWWLLRPHQVVEYRDRTYLVAWCEETGDWRHFRSDRMHQLELLPDRFVPRADFVPVARPADLFRAGDTAESVVVRFAPAVARWIRERYPDAELQDDGSVLVRFSVANPEWLVRRVLEYGPDAEVVEPAAMRRLVSAAVA